MKQFISLCLAVAPLVATDQQDTRDLAVPPLLVEECTIDPASAGVLVQTKTTADSTFPGSSIDVLLDAAEGTYKLLDDAIEKDADLTGVGYIVIPEVGATDTAITSRTVQLDRLFNANPNLTLVVAFADGVTAVGDSFCCDCPKRRSTLSQHVKKIFFTGKNIKTVGNDFFAYAEALTHVDFGGLSALETIKDGFFAIASAVTSVDFRGLSAIKSIGEYFFLGALALKLETVRGLPALKKLLDDSSWDALMHPRIYD